MVKYITAFFLIAATSGFTTPISGGELVPILDQSQTAHNGSIAFWNWERSVAQTFTAGFSGELAGISLWMGQSGTLSGPEYISIQIVEWSGSEEGGELGYIDALAPVSYASPSYFDFSAEGVELISGNQYAFILRNDLDYLDLPDPYHNISVNADWFGANYNGGNLFTQIDEEWVAWGQPGAAYADLQFETYILGTQVAAVPEPASLALFGFGVLGLGGLYRRKKA